MCSCDEDVAVDVGVCETCDPTLECEPVVIEIHNAKLLVCIRFHYKPVPATHHMVELCPDGIYRYSGNSFCESCARSAIVAPAA